MDSAMRRGEIWLVDLEPAPGSEANKQRPAVVVSNDAERTGLSVDSKAQAEQIRSISVGRLRGRVGRPLSEELAQLDEALRLHLELWSY